MRYKKRLFQFLNRIPLWTQLFVMTIFVISITILVILVNNYSRNRNTILKTEVTTSNQLLNLETENLEKYIQDLVYFSVQPCYDTRLSQILSLTAPIDVWQKSYMKNQIRAYYYSRNDLISYNIYLIHQKIEFRRNAKAQKIADASQLSASDREVFSQCEKGDNVVILPSDSDKAFIDFYHSIIRIKDRKPIAIVNFTVDKTYVDSINRNHNNNGEFICILNKDNRLLYSGNTGRINAGSQSLLTEIEEKAGREYSIMSVENEPFIVTTSESDAYHLKLVSFTPLSVVDTAINRSFQISFLMGVIVWGIAVLLITILIRLTTNPLSTLARNLRNVGNGDFTSTVDIGGNREIANLSYDFNYMTKHIDELIKKNYISEINEKTSRLIALEAQLNPHFLYNTLQVISTEALINDQPRIHLMITSLASILRYTIKGGDFVSLFSEMEYVNHYILLQKMRLEEKLNVFIENDETGMDILIPKISIQTLVENSILHGMGKNGDAIHISITARLQEEFLSVTVADDGCGISPDYLSTLKEEFDKNTISHGNSGIGLINLNSRLKLLYSGKANIQISSEEGSYTSITMLIPAIKEVSDV
ncbi:two-component system, sensor histidine kinase YesM [Anaerocolumna jejuensis DSM 15929]|uniref:histidine kinase n=1 Tax=Anaerocolumna jejuensis DSM 15929 TaxID=1121322 RepID=A0A1M7D8L0_9FIRM|nr:histidine kinase [Anaerocolumna jejuensis]SHL75795.1 two-component system, sensor histidine kinase YesM [Anaerocolumna jejuensis DSM 15929]